MFVPNSLVGEEDEEDGQKLHHPAELKSTLSFFCYEVHNVNIILVIIVICIVVAISFIFTLIYLTDPV